MGGAAAIISAVAGITGVASNIYNQEKQAKAARKRASEREAAEKKQAEERKKRILERKADSAQLAELQRKKNAQQNPSIATSASGLLGDADIQHSELKKTLGE